MAFTDILYDHDRLMQERAHREAADDAKAVQRNRSVPNKELLTAELKTAVSHITGSKIYDVIEPHLTNMASDLHQKLVAAKFDLPSEPVPVVNPAMIAWKDTALADQIAAKQLLNEVVAPEYQKYRGENCVVLAPRFLDKLAPELLGKFENIDPADERVRWAVTKILMAYAKTDVVPHPINDEHGKYFYLEAPIDVDALRNDLSGASRSPQQPA